jgi:hypothetical protein
MIDHKKVTKTQVLASFSLQSVPLSCPQQGKPKHIKWQAIPGIVSVALSFKR